MARPGSSTTDPHHEAPPLSRRDAMALCAEATAEELSALLAAIEQGDGPLPSSIDLRPAERGLVMLRGRMGGDGSAFNLGEATVTRAAVRLADGRTGFAYQLGRDAGRARNAALIDALWQGPERPAVQAAFGSIRARLSEAAASRARRTAATRVDFFTMVRGD